MRKVRKKLKSIMSNAYNRYGWNYKVKTRYGELHIETYVRRFTKNLFDCLISCCKVRKGIFDADTDIPSKVYHGTSTKFLSEIRKNGLLPSKAGQYWEEDKDKKPHKVCLTDSMYAAEFYARNATEIIGGQPVVLVFNIRDVREKIKIRFEIFKDEPSTPFDIYREIYSHEPIPPDKIRDWYFVPEISANTVLHDLKHHYG